MLKPHIKLTLMLIVLLLSVGWSAAAVAQGLDLPYSGSASEPNGPAFKIENSFWWSTPHTEQSLAILGQFSVAGRPIIDIETGEIIDTSYQNVGRLGGYDFGVEGICGTINGYGVRAMNNVEGGTGLYAIGGTDGFAGFFEGDIKIAGTGMGIIFPDGTKQTSAGGGDHANSDNDWIILGNNMYSGVSGNVGIGTTNPNERLVIQGNSGGTAIGRINQIGERKYTGWRLDREYAEKWFIGMDTRNEDLIFRSTSSFNAVIIDSSSGNVGVGTEPTEHKLDVAGTTATDVLVIRGGMDLAEPFAVSDSQSIPKGAVLVIDDENPGQLKLSTCPYNPRVAGVVSGAGNINPGLTLTQREVCTDGINVALTGRVYALADTSNGPIVPGDLLTTSGTPGHAMKATDTNRSFGAIIGKAMSPLDKGRGLVLVLVCLQ